MTSSFVLVLADATIEAKIITFASRNDPSLVLQQMELRSDKSCQIRVRTKVDTHNVRGHAINRKTGDVSDACDGSLLWIPEGGISSCGVAYSSHCEAALGDRRFGDLYGSGPLTTHYALKLTLGKTVMLQQFAAMVPSVMHHKPDEEAVRRLAKATSLGFEKLRTQNCDEWAQLWKSRIKVDGASADHQRLIDAGFYYLNSSTHRASPAATSMFGLASWHNYNYYYGHVMWDIDAFCIPPLLFVQPDAARSLLDFRARHSDSAAANAQLDGCIGLRFPWQAAPSSGEEASPGAGAAAANAAHVSIHVARAFALHAEISQDRRYLRSSGWKVMAGVADWLTQRLTWTERGPELVRATGPAEVEEPPDNDSYTLMAIFDLLTRTIRIGESIGAEIPSVWREILGALELPKRADGAIPSHDDFQISEPKGATPSPLAGFFPFDFPATAEQKEATLEIFLARWRDYVGSPMLPALYPTWAAMAGDRRLALRLFEEGYVAYDKGRFHQCLEYREDHPDNQVPAGPFMANIGGMLMTMLFGFTGVEVSNNDPASWGRRKVALPHGWESIEVDRLWVAGRAMKLVARHGEMAMITPV